MKSLHYSPIAQFALVSEWFIRSRVAWRGPMMMMHAVTEACNARCPFCVFRHGKRRPDELTLAEIAALYSEARAIGIRYVHLWGGEPLVHPHIVEIFTAAKGAGLITGMVTNGMFLERHAEAVAAHIDRLYVSVDHPSSKHDELRRTPRLFDALIAGVKKVRELAPQQSIVFNMTLGRDNADGVEDMARLCRDLKVRMYLAPMRRGAGADVDATDNDARVLPWEEQRPIWARLVALRDAGYPNSKLLPLHAPPGEAGHAAAVPVPLAEDRDRHRRQRRHRRLHGLGKPGHQRPRRPAARPRPPSTNGGSARTHRRGVQRVQRPWTGRAVAVLEHASRDDRRRHPESGPPAIATIRRPAWGWCHGTDASPDLRLAGPFAVTTASATSSANGCDMAYDTFTAVGSPAADTVVILTHGFARDKAQMSGWANQIAAWGVTVVTPNPCHLSPIDADHPQNAADLRALADHLGTPKVIYAGHSAGGLASLLATADDPRAIAMLGLDGVDNAALGAAAAPGVGVPIAGLVGEASTCNSDGNGVVWWSSAEDGRAVRVVGSDHCDFESPTDEVCTAFCGGPAADDPAIPAVVGAMATGWIRARAGVDPAGDDWWYAAGGWHDTLLSDGAIADLP